MADGHLIYISHNFKQAHRRNNRDYLLIMTMKNFNEEGANRYAQKRWNCRISHKIISVTGTSRLWGCRLLLRSLFKRVSLAINLSNRLHFCRSKLSIEDKCMNGWMNIPPWSWRYCLIFREIFRQDFAVFWSTLCLCACDNGYCFEI